ncbi:MAG: hypothetical protein RLZZ609_2951 [Cyanobacteriota bacterium]|jgi:hypothetical protein
MLKRPWYKLPIPLGLLKLSAIRARLRSHNLHDTSQLPDATRLPKPVADPAKVNLQARTADGSYNDLQHPEMGMAGSRFGRNVPLEAAVTDEANLLKPSPRLVSQVLLTRKEFIPATILNLNAASWIQFQTHDWFSHGTNQPDRQIKVPVADGDPWEHQRPMGVDLTLDDPTRPSDSDDQPRTFINKETHWWDASQIYGSTPEMVEKLRSHQDGKMRIEDNGFLPLDPQLGIDLVAFPGTWWVGLSMLHTLFVREHNSICLHLKAAYPNWGDEDLFNHARLINAALIAKIHTVEWTPAILPNPITEQAMCVNWWGLLGRDFRRAFGRIGSGEILSGIVGSPTDHHSAPYSITEEFTSVYRMHPLIPDGFELYSCANDAHLGSRGFLDGFDKKTRSLTEEIGFANLFYSFGLAHPGAVTLHNYPDVLRNLRKPNGEVFDLATVDILRDRERGVPRYNKFRELIGRNRVNSFEEISSDPARIRLLREVYDNDVNQVDLMIGLYSEDLPPGFGFSETAFWIFILMASRRLKSDRFFTNDYRAKVYTQEGLDWIERNSMVSVLKRHHPELTPALRGIDNAFKPWRRVR